MDLTHAHLYLNHLPIIGSIILFVFFTYSVIKKKENLIRISLWFFICIAIIIIPVYFTGEPAEESVLKAAGIGEETIEPHESAALVSLIIMEVIGAASLITLLKFKKDKKIPSWLGYSLAILAIVYLGAVGVTANLGGQIRHTEIRSEKTPTN